MRQCSVEGCDVERLAKGLCSKHYSRVRRIGGTALTIIPCDDESRFWAKVEKTESCWLWRAGFGRGGYGLFWLKNRMAKSHRYSYELANGPIPERDSYHGLCVCHKCDNPACVNPSHLFLGTNAENTQDKCDKTRQQRGEAITQSKLTESQVLEIRTLLLTGLTHRKVGACFGVSPATISSVGSRRTWKHI